MKLPFSYIVWLYMLSFLLVNCNQRSDLNTVSIEIDSLIISSDTVIVSEVQSTDLFYDAVEKFSKDFPEYKASSPLLIDSLNDPSNHWLLMLVEHHRTRLKKSDDSFSKKKLLKLPTSSELDMINSIRQGAFYRSYPKNNDVLFEAWNFDNERHAERWLVLLNDSLSRNDFTKPPRFQWVEGSKLYLVSTRSAAQWFELSDSLIMRLSGKTKQQLSNLYYPIDLKHFKKWTGSANSSVINTVPYLFEENTGPHYSYFYFIKQRLRGEARTKANGEFPSKKAFRITTSLYKPLTGSEQFNSIGETLVAVQCSINEPALNSLDIVGKTTNELKELFGTMRYEKEDIKVFGHSNRIVVAKMDQEKVNIFKYLRLNESFETLLTNENMIGSILSFE